ncbi:MAG: HD domain-containing protein [Clostridia bacterium]|jgi:predicted HD superfamily hydrolase involved in NAD metabolism|nr:HD domain-containing protein [Clostridia bacterium]MBT7122880.1 HD domain-containing protein [Clostridia bacterium]
MDKYIDYLTENLDGRRVKHSIGTAEQAQELARIHGGNEQKAYIAGLLHDVAKGKCECGPEKLAKEYDIVIDEVEQSNPELIHGKLGAKIVSEQLGIEDEDILNAICWHTTGRADMSLLEKIVYIADLTEPSRQFENIDVVRELAKKDIDAAMIYALNCVIEFVQCKGYTLHPNSTKAQEYFLKEEKNKFELQ